MMMQEWFSDGFAVQVPAGTSILDAELQIPAAAKGLIILSQAGNRGHGSQRVQNLAEGFLKHGYGFLLMDLLTEEESEIGKQAEERTQGSAGSSFDEGMLAERLYDTLDWARELPEAESLPIGLFGAGAGAWAAFAVASARPSDVCAVVAAGITPSEPGLLSQVRTPVLILCGEVREDALKRGDPAVREDGVARACYEALGGRKRLECLPGLQEDKGPAKHDWNGNEARVTEKIARLASHWFETYLSE